MFVQGALLDAVTGVGADESFGAITRHHLDATSWVDHQAGWLAGSGALLDELIVGVAWRHGRRVMYDRLVDEPRLTCALTPADGPPDVAALAAVLGQRYERRFDRVWCNLYRDGHDSVAWHSDREGRSQRDPTIAIVSLGSPRTFALRPKGGGRVSRFSLGHGDLLVMGGACQHDWEHTVPKTATPVGVRVSVTFRHGEAGVDRRDLGRRWGPGAQPPRRIST